MKGLKRPAMQSVLFFFFLRERFEGGVKKEREEGEKREKDQREKERKITE